MDESRPASFTIARFFPAPWSPVDASLRRRRRRAARAAITRCLVLDWSKTQAAAAREGAPRGAPGRRLRAQRRRLEADAVETRGPAARRARPALQREDAGERAAADLPRGAALRGPPRGGAREPEGVAGGPPRRRAQGRRRAHVPRRLRRRPRRRLREDPRPRA